MVAANAKPVHPILLVDDEDAWLNSLAFMLEFSAGLDNLIRCNDSRKVMEIMARQEIGMVLLDLTMPHLSGDELLPRLAEEHPHVPVIVLSGMNQLETAVHCIKAGAADYFVKTEEKERLLATIRRLLSVQELQRENRQLKDEILQGGLKDDALFSDIVTRSPRMHALFRYIEAIAGSGEAVLITGESGVGKELFARAVHGASRPDRPWVPVNVAGLDDNVFSDTLFGHRRGAFTGADRDRPGMVEQARGGTLFLDEIGDLSTASQVKLLRLLQEGEYLPLGADRPRRAEVRIICATNQDLETKVAEGAFRKDLYYRLVAHRIEVPPLRRRREDVPLLLDLFLEEVGRTLCKKKPTPPDELFTLLATYHFPGNVRELRAMVHDAVSTHRGGKLSLAAFRRAIERQPIDSSDESRFAPGLETWPELLRRLDCMPTLSEAAGMLVDEAMRRADGNQSQAARLLGISRQALGKRLKNRQ